MPLVGGEFQQRTRGNHKTSKDHPYQRKETVLKLHRPSSDNDIDSCELKRAAGGR